MELTETQKRATEAIGRIDAQMVKTLDQKRIEHMQNERSEVEEEKG